MEPPARQISDAELMDELKFQAAMWFNNHTLLLLEELFKRYMYAKSRQTSVK